jgi:hypothetical protein
MYSRVQDLLDYTLRLNTILISNFFPGDPLVCLTSLATKDDLFFFRQAMELGVFTNMVALKSLKLPHNPDRTKLPTHGALNIPIS